MLPLFEEFNPNFEKGDTVTMNGKKYTVRSKSDDAAVLSPVDDGADVTVQAEQWDEIKSSTNESLDITPPNAVRTFTAQEVYTFLVNNHPEVISNQCQLRADVASSGNVIITACVLAPNVSGSINDLYKEMIQPTHFTYSPHVVYEFKELSNRIAGAAGRQLGFEYATWPESKISLSGLPDYNEGLRAIRGYFKRFGFNRRGKHQILELMNIKDMIEFVEKTIW